MIRKPVVSSNLVSVGYDEFLSILGVEFKGGAIYHYYGVPVEVYNELINADSVGKYLNMFIKGKYSYEKVGVVGV